MKYSFVAVSALALAVQASPADYGNGGGSATYSAPAGSFTPTQGGPCGGGNAYCAGTSGQTNIILRCTGTTLQAGNCNDNLNEPEFGAVCIDSAPAPGGNAQCSANPAPASTGGAATGGATYPTGSAPAESSGAAQPTGTYPAGSGAPSGSAPAETGTAPAQTYPAGSSGAGGEPAPSTGGAAAPTYTPPSGTAAAGNATASGEPVPSANVPTNDASARGYSLAAIIGAAALMFFA
jgi:hypothetical protein